MKHKHADLIHAWADGAEIQVNAGCGWEDCPVPTWAYDEYRIKPEEKKPVVRWLWAYQNVAGEWYDKGEYMTDEEAKDCEHLKYYKYIKLEWSRTEFPE